MSVVITSPEDVHYNCIAWAAEDTLRFWWPRGGYWPAGVKRDETVDAFIEAYGSLGYKLCDNDVYEQGFQKIALFVNAMGKPTHAARQLNNGKWTSKLGQSYDVEHDLHALVLDIPQLATLYGAVTVLFKKNV